VRTSSGMWSTTRTLGISAVALIVTSGTGAIRHGGHVPLNCGKVESHEGAQSRRSRSNEPLVFNLLKIANELSHEYSRGA